MNILIISIMSKDVIYVLNNNLKESSTYEKAIANNINLMNQKELG